MDAAAQYALAYALTTSAGVRALLPLAALSIAAHSGWVHVPASFAWLGGGGVMWILIAVALAEMFADKIPLLDHALHFVQIAGKPAAAAILVGGAVHTQSHEQLIILMILGALNALGIHGAIASARAASTVTTGGLANPVLSTVEDTGSVAGVVIAFAMPMLAAMLAVVFAIVLVWVARKTLRSQRNLIRR